MDSSQDPHYQHAERLPFTVRPAETEQDLRDAVKMRRAAYGRHMPELAATMTQADNLDRGAGTAVLLARAKLDGATLGTMRIQSAANSPLLLEQSVELPAPYCNATRAEATRLGVCTGRIGTVVKAALYKAFYLHCVANSIEYMVVAGRHPVDRDYERLRFSDVFEPGSAFPMRHAGNALHRVLAFHVPYARTLWSEPKHPMFRFVFETDHSDICIAPLLSRPQSTNTVDGGVSYNDPA